MPRPPKVRPSASACGDTMLSDRKSFTWSEVIVRESPEKRPSDNLRIISGNEGERSRAPPKRDLDEPAAAPGRRQDERHDPPERRDFRPAQFINCPWLSLAVDGQRDQLSPRPRRRPAEVWLAPPPYSRRECRHEPRHRREPIEELILRPEHDRGASCDDGIGQDLPHFRRLAEGLGFSRRRKNPEGSAPIADICTKTSVPACFAALAMDCAPRW